MAPNGLKRYGVRICCHNIHSRTQVRIFDVFGACETTKQRESETKQKKTVFSFAEVIDRRRFTPFQLSLHKSLNVFSRLRGVAREHTHTHSSDSHSSSSSSCGITICRHARWMGVGTQANPSHDLFVFISFICCERGGGGGGVSLRKCFCCVLGPHFFLSTSLAILFAFVAANF